MCPNLRGLVQFNIDLDISVVDYSIIISIEPDQGAFCEATPVSVKSVKNSDRQPGTRAVTIEGETEKYFTAFEFGIAIALSVIGTLVLCMVVRYFLKYKRNPVFYGPYACAG